MRIVSADDWPAVTSLVSASMELVLLANRVHAMARKAMGCTEVGLSSKQWPALVPQHGRGPKHPT